MSPQIFSLTHNNITLEYSPERWGLITQIYFWETPVLFFNEETFYDLTKNVRGGIPIMFPNAWPLEKVWNFFELWNIPQHGFARNSKFFSQTWENFVEMKLLANNTTKELFPYDFELTLRAEIIEKSVKISLSIKNIGEQNIPVAPWFHPYFLISENKKDEFFLEKNWEKIEEYKKYHWETIYTKNPWKFQTYLWENTLELDYSETFQKLWLWSEPGKDFLCIEPTFWDEGALIENPCVLQSNEEKIFSIKIKKQ